MGQQNLADMGSLHTYVDLRLLCVNMKKTKAVDYFFKKSNSSGVDQYNLIAIIEFII